MAGIDLHDLHDLRSRSLHFIHDLVNSLRESGVRQRMQGGLSTTEAFLTFRLGPHTRSRQPIPPCV
jgi:hypothetical protein